MFTRTLEKIAGRQVSGGEKAFVIFLILVLLAIFYIVLDANKYATEVNIIAGEGKVGVNPTQESLDFGDMSLGTTAVRRVDIKNGTSLPVFVFVLRVGGINDLTKVSDSSFVLNGNEEKKIEFTTYVPASAKIGDHYSGHVYIFKIPGPWGSGKVSQTTEQNAALNPAANTDGNSTGTGVNLNATATVPNIY